MIRHPLAFDFIVGLADGEKKPISGEIGLVLGRCHVDILIFSVCYEMIKLVGLCCKQRRNMVLGIQNGIMAVLALMKTMLH